MNFFAERLARAIEADGRKKGEIAKAVGIKAPALSRWLSGAKPEARHLNKLAKVLNVSVNWLMEDAQGDASSVATTARDRLRRAREANGMSVADLAKKVGYSVAVYQEIEEGRSQMGEKMMKRVAQTLGIPVEDLMEGVEEPVSRDVPIGTFGAVPDLRLPPGMRAKYVPLISMAQCGTMGAFDDVYSHEGFVAFDVSDPKAFATRCVGDSMAPQILPGDVVVVGPSSPPRNNDTVMAKLTEDQGGDVMIKIYSVAGDRVTLSSYNPTFPRLEFARSDFAWIYPVVQWTRTARRA